MRRYSLCCIGVLSLVLNSSYPAQAESLMPVPFTDVQVDDAFWSPRIKVNRERVLPHDFKYCETTGRINNFLKAAGKMEGPFEGIFFNDLFELCYVFHLQVLQLFGGSFELMITFSKMCFDFIRNLSRIIEISEQNCCQQTRCSCMRFLL